MQRDSQLQFRNNAFQIKLSRQPSRVAKLKQVLATLGEEDDMYPAVQEALSKDEYQAHPSPFQVNPVCNVNVELDHLRAEISRLRQQQDGIRPVAASVEANHIPVER